MTLPEILAELFEMVEDEEIENDICPHNEPANTLDWCEVCFITNMFLNVSEDESSFIEETTEAQREAIIKLYDKYCNFEEWE